MRLDFTRIASQASVVSGVRRTTLLLLTLAIVLSPHGRCVFAQSLLASENSDATASQPDVLRMERVPIEGGAELVTILARLSGLETSEKENWVPLVSVLRDTLGDADGENDRLRYVWPLTYTRPTL